MFLQQCDIVTDISNTKIYYSCFINLTGVNIMCNVGGIDRIIRIIAGLFLISLVFVGDRIIGQNVIWGWVGLVPLATGIFKFCPAYKIFGLKTC